MNKSDEINELAKALAELQAVMKPVVFDSVNPYYKSKYASIGSMIESLKVEAPKRGISWSQFPVSEDSRIGADTIVMHTSGQWLSERFLLPMDVNSKNPIQEGGKAITYARRYALAAIFGMYADEDTDGQSVEQKREEKQGKSEEKKPGWNEEIHFQSFPPATAKYAVEQGIDEDILENSILPYHAELDHVKRWIVVYRKAEEDGADPIESANNAYLKFADVNHLSVRFPGSSANYNPLKKK